MTQHVGEGESWVCRSGDWGGSALVVALEHEQVGGEGEGWCKGREGKVVGRVT